MPTWGWGVCRAAIWGPWCRLRYASTEATHSDACVNGDGIGAAQCRPVPLPAASRA